MKHPIIYILLLLSIFLIIFPVSAITWVSYSGHYNATLGGDYLEMWNTTGSTTWVAPTNVNPVWYTVVAGGGEGVYGGGGGGGVLNGTISISAGTTYNISVGMGGSGASQIGGNSSFANTTTGNGINAAGGGYGGTNNAVIGPGGNGGSGGGGGFNSAATYIGGNGIAGQGNNGGSSSGASNFAGGAGGAGEAGTNGVSTGGKGGNGTSINITGTSTLYGGGGGGGCVSGTPGSGGSGGGGNGACATNNAVKGTDGLGGGSGGRYTPTIAALGGNGTVIIRYTTSGGGTAPVSSFIADVISGTPPLTVQFNDTSVNTPTAWNWSFKNVAGNNTQVWWSQIRNSSLPITSAGNYTIVLNSSNSYGYNISTQSTWINASGAPDLISNFTANTTTGYQSPYPVSFTDTSTGSPVTWNWTFGDTYTSTLQNPSHIYTVANNYTIQQNVTNATGGYAVSTKYVNLTTDDDIWLKSWMQFENATVTDLKGIAWTANGNAVVSTTTKKFGTQSLYIPAANPSSYISSPSSSIWDRSSVAGELEFWINITSIGQANQPIIRRSNNGGGGISSGWGFFNINATQNGYAFWYGNGATNYTTPFTITPNTWTHVVLVRNTSQYWNVYVNGVKVNGETYVGGLSLDTTNPFTIGANEAGTRFGFYLDEFRYTQGVPRFVSDFSTPYAQYNGNVGVGYVNINPNATLLYKSYPGYAQPVYNTTPHNRTVQIQNVTNATSLSFAINFPNIYEHSGTPFINATVAATYPDLVLSNVGIDNDHGIDTMTISRSGGGGISSLFDNRTSLVDIPVVYYNYTTDQYFDTFFAYGNITDGQYSVTYPIYNFYDTLLPIGDWTIYTNFSANVTSTSVSKPIKFTDGSFGEPTGYTTWNWDFGDGSTSTAQNPVYAYSMVGNYSVSLTSTLVANNSVTNTTTKTNYITINAPPPAPPVAAFTASPTVVSLGSIVQFNDTSSDAPTSWIWVFGDGSGSSSRNPTHTYTSIGLYTVNLTASSAYGTNTISKTNYINVTALADPVASFTSNVSYGQYPLAVKFTDTSLNIPTSWLWDFGDSGTSTLQNPEHTFMLSGNYTVNLTATNGGGSNKATHYINATTVYGFNRQDLTMNQQFILTVNIVDSSTNLPIPIVTVMDNLGNNKTTTTGTFMGTYPYSTVVLYLSSSGYDSKSASYIMDSDRSEIVQMVKTTTPTNPSVVYIPQQVRIRLIDLQGYPLNGVTVTATPLNFTAPSNWTDILFGINPAVNIVGTAVYGTTGSDGSWVAPMLPSIKYNLTMVRASDVNYNLQIYPSQTEYTFTLPIGLVPIPTSAANIVTYSLANASISSTQQYINMSYSDTSVQGTTSLTFAVYNLSGAVIASTSYSGAAANSKTYSQIITVAQGQSYTYAILANQSEYGWINQTKTVTFANQVALIGSAPGWVEQFVAIGLIIIFAALFSIFSKTFAMVGIPILTWYFQFVLGWLPSTFLSTIALGTMLTLGVLMYIRQRENMIQ